MTIEQHLKCIGCSVTGVTCVHCGRSAHSHWAHGTENMRKYIDYNSKRAFNGLVCIYCVMEMSE